MNFMRFTVLSDDKKKPDVKELKASGVQIWSANSNCCAVNYFKWVKF